jgi:hypothetical protein
MKQDASHPTQSCLSALNIRMFCGRGQVVIVLNDGGIFLSMHARRAVWVKTFTGKWRVRFFERIPNLKRILINGRKPK